MRNSQGRPKTACRRVLFWSCVLVLNGTGFLLLSHRQRLEWGLVPALMATPVADTAAVNGSCNDTPVSAFAPNPTYTITFSVPVAATIPSCSTTVSLSGAVNGDTSPTVGCSIADQNGFAVLSSRTFSVKIGGLACTTEDESNLQIHGDGADNTAMDVAFSPVSQTNWIGSHKVDQTSEGNKVTLFGTGGQVAANTVLDGQDNDNLTNGEVEFGGTVASSGGSKIFIKQDVVDYDVQAGTDKETLTLTMTPQ